MNSGKKRMLGFANLGLIEKSDGVKPKPFVLRLQRAYLACADLKLANSLFTFWAFEPGLKYTTARQSLQSWTRSCKESRVKFNFKLE